MSQSAPPGDALARPEHMWLAHHDAAHLDRCVHVRGVPVCRRCAVLYPLAALSAIGILVTEPSTALLVAAMWLLPVPVVLEWIGEHLATLRYSPGRQVALTALAAPALGAALAINATEPLSLTAVAPMATWAAVCAAAAGWGWWRSVPDLAPGWEDRHGAEEAARRERLEQLLATADAHRTERPD